MKKTKLVSIKKGNDKGKQFIIELPDAFRGEILLNKIMEVADNNNLDRVNFSTLVTAKGGNEIWGMLTRFIKFKEGTTESEVNHTNIKSLKTLLFLKSHVLEMLTEFLNNLKPLKIRTSSNKIKVRDYVNIPTRIGAVMTSRLATLKELQEFYSIEDLFFMVEVLQVNNENNLSLTGGIKRNISISA